jgi:tRNA nucleotidyltransferase (CCA-adding enzyme)
MLEIPEYVSFVCERLHRYGKQAYVVGGAVRDLLSDRIPNDYDIATDATPNEVEKFFEPWHDRLTDKFHARTLPTGKQYGTITVLLGTRSVEVTTFRTDGQYFDGRRPESLSSGSPSRKT